MVDHLACIHRGEQLGEVKCECGSGQTQMVPYFACSVHGRCIVRRQPRQEPERSLFHLCAGCWEREPPG